LVLKHMKNWSYAELEREVRANLVYREFTRIGMGAVPDEKTMVRLGQALGPEVVEKLHAAIVAEARRRHVVRGRRMRVDTTVVETNIHYPTDSQLLADAVRVITRTVKKMEEKAGTVKRKFRNRLRSIGRRLVALGKAAMQRGEKAEAKRKELYQELMQTTRQVVREARATAARVSAEINAQADSAKRAAVQRLAARLAVTIVLAERILRQTQARVVDGNTHYGDKVLSIFEVETEAIRKGKAAKPTEFGKAVKIQEAENQIITHYEVYDRRPADQHLLVPAIEKHQEIFGCAPDLVAADAGFHSKANEEKAAEMGVTKLAVPSRQGAGKKRKRRPRWFRRGQRWRVGCEGRISVLKRRSGLSRSRYRGAAGMRRWVGMGVIADNLISLGKVLSSG
jgi:IS5 family transposase